MRFISNCLGLRDFTLEAFYTKKDQISYARHPNKIIFKLFGSKYTMSFSGPKNVNLNSVLRSFDYMKVYKFFIKSIFYFKYLQIFKIKQTNILQNLYKSVFFFGFLVLR